MEHDIEECSVLSEIAQITNEHVEQKIVEKAPYDNPNDVMLQPDHPLLQKFQQVLKEQLERQIQKLSEEVHELEVGIKKKEQERYEIAAVIQSVQHITAKQQEQIKQNEVEIKNYATERMELEKEVTQVKEVYKEHQKKLFEAEKKEKEIRNEVETMNFLIKQMNDWEEKLNADLAVNRRVSDKSKIDKKQVQREKRYLDFIVYRLMSEIFRLENSIEHCSMILDAQEKEREQYAEMIATNKKDMELMESEHKRLLSSWHSVLIAVERRDKLYNEAQAELTQKQQILRNTVAEVEATRKLCNEEMEKEEHFAMEQNKIDVEMARLNAKLQSEQNKVDILEAELLEIQPLAMQTRRDFEEVSTELANLKDSYENLTNELTRQKNRKVDLERQMVHNLQGHDTGDSDLRFLHKHIQERREHNRVLEMEVTNIENTIANLGIQIEETKRINLESQAYLKELSDQLKEKEKELKNLTTELTELERRFKKKQMECEIMSMKYREIEEHYMAHGIKAEMAERQKECDSLEEMNRKLETQWLRQQNNFISLSEKRQTQLQEINTTRALNMLLYQEKIRMEDEFNELKRKEHETNKNMALIRTKLDKLCQGIVETKDFQNMLAKDNDVSRYEYGQQLKDAELECIKLESDVAAMDKQKVDLTKELADVKKEILAWEADIKRSEEQKKQISTTKGADNEITAMRVEIHRMTVRYGQLKKAQEKLIQDLNGCISRRDFISSQAEAAEKRLALGGNVSSRAVYMRKLENVKSKLKKTEQEIKVMEKKLSEACKLEQDLDLQSTQQEMEIKIQEEKLAELDKNLEIAEYERQKDLDLLLFKQHKLSAYMNICKGLYKRHFRSVTSLENEYEKEQDINAKLQAVVENLLVDFPNYYLEFNRILNLLRLTSTQ